MSEATKTNSWLTESIALAGLSAYAYLLAFFYEFGYCWNFHIPASFIAPNISTLLVAAAAVGSTLLPALSYLGFTTPLFKAARDPARRPYRDLYAFLAVLSVAGVILAAIYGISIRGIAIFLALSAALLLVLFLPALLSNRKLPIRDRLEKHADLQEQDPFQLVDVLVAWRGRSQVLAGMLAIVLLGVTFLIGDAEASRQSRFLVLKSEPTVVILRNYGDLLIATTFERSTKKVSSELRLMWLSEKKDLALLNEPIGPLQPARSTPQGREKSTSDPHALPVPGPSQAAQPINPQTIKGHTP